MRRDFLCNHLLTLRPSTDPQPAAPTALPSLKLSPQLLQDGFLFGERAGRELRVDELTVGFDLEAAPVGGY